MSDFETYAQLDALLAFFEYQEARATLLERLCKTHADSHPAHRFHSWDRHKVPDILSPTPDQHHDQATTSRVRPPRIQFWDDVERLQTYYADSK